MGNTYGITLYDFNQKITSPLVLTSSKDLLQLIPERASHTINDDGKVEAHFGVFGEMKPQIVVSTTVEDYLKKLGPAPGVTLFFTKHQYEYINSNHGNNVDDGIDITDPNW